MVNFVQTPKLSAFRGSTKVCADDKSCILLANPVESKDEGTPSVDTQQSAKDFCAKTCNKRERAEADEFMPISDKAKKRPKRKQK